MAITKAEVTILASTSVAAGSTFSSPGATSSSIDVRTYYGGDLTYKITNGASAPGVALTLRFEASGDGTRWYNYQTVAGDLTASSVNSNTITLDRGVMYVRVIAYGNTTNAVTVEAYLQAVTAV